MRKTKTLMLFLLGACMTGTYAQTEVIDISTGKHNSTGALITLGQSDDSWSVVYPNGTTSIPRTCTLSTWAESGCSRWISPHTVGSDASNIGALSGVYTYKISFSITGNCMLTTATLNLNKLGGDDNITSYRINGYTVPLTPGTPVDYATLSNHSINIPVGQLYRSGSNTLEITVDNDIDRTGLNICGNITLGFQALTPNFDINTTFQNDYFTMTAVPTNTTDPLLPGFGYYWSVEKLDNLGNVVCVIENPSAWWTGLNNNFRGMSYTMACSGTLTSLPTSPSPGQFLYNTTYRIRRGVWSSACDWRDYMATVYWIKSSQGGHPTPYIVYEEGDGSWHPQTTLSMPEPESGNTALAVYPNPGTGLFTLDLPDIQEGTVEVCDLSGKKVYSRVLHNPGGTYSIDLSNYSRGIYILSLRSGDLHISQKLILQ